tara:strand:- start:790 stop:1023 length:234 start_codon:yes stop_codon:yes gene_type:complete
MKAKKETFTNRQITKKARDYLANRFDTSTAAAKHYGVTPQSVYNINSGVNRPTRQMLIDMKVNPTPTKKIIYNWSSI